MICAVIPTFNSEATLASLLAQLRHEAARIVITDGGSGDQTLKIASTNAAVIAVGGSGRGPQLRRGAAWSGSCNWLLILHADSRLPENWRELTQQHIKKHPEKAGYFDLRFNSPRFSARIIEILVRIRCAAFGLPYGDQGLLISKALYANVGGYSAISLFEDVALIQALEKTRIKRLGGAIITDAEKFEREGFFRQGWRNFRLLRRYLNGESPEDIAKDYR